MERSMLHRLSSRSTRRFYAGSAALALILGTAAFAADAPSVGPKAETPVVAKSPDTTSQRLLEADKEPQNWITHHKDYNAQRFSTLDQINAGNVKGMKVAWTMATRRPRGRRHLDGMAASRARRSSRTASCTSLTVGARSTSWIQHGGRGDLAVEGWTPRPITIGPARSLAAASITAASLSSRDLVISHTLDGRLIATDKEDRPGQMAASGR